MTFELTSKQLKYKDIFNKDFLELEFYAISDIDPNRNRTHFTLDSMKKAISSFVNKPILGFFKNGDFEEHNGSIGYDREEDREFFDTEKGERILGLIRESDPIDIVEKDGLHWIRFRCAIWVQYCYKQVRKILKDRSKKVSVEVMVHDKMVRDDGVEEILDFSLRGVTILGSRNGRPIMEGIQGAHLSLIDDFENENYQNQKNVLSFAYKQIDEYGVKSSNIDASFNAEKEVEVMEENHSEVTENLEEKEKENSQENYCDLYEDQKEEVHEEVCEETHEESCEEVHEESVEENQEEVPAEEVPANVAESAEGISSEQASEVKEILDDAKDGEMKGLEDRLQELTTMCDKYAKEVSDYQSKCDEYCATIQNLEQEIDKFKSNQEQFADYEEIKSRMFAAEAKVWKHFCDELEMKACEMMKDEKINEEDIHIIKEKCQKGEYSAEEEISKDVAYAIFKARPAQNKRYATGLSVEKPVENKNKNTMTREERIAARCGKK